MLAFLTPSLSREERALARVARWMVYGNERVSFRTMEDKFFRQMLEGFWLPSRQACPYMTAEQLYKWIDGEWGIMLNYFEVFAKTQMEGSAFNPTLQLLHDAGTLDDHRKREAVGVSGVTPDWEDVVTVAIGFCPIENGTDEALEARLRELTEERLKFELEQVICSTMADRAAMTAAKRLALEMEACGMHDLSKIAESLLGILTRSVNTVIQNPFPECVHLMERAHKTATHSVDTHF